MVKPIHTLQLNPGNPASYGLLMAIEQPALLFSKSEKLVTINKPARMILGLGNKKVTNIHLSALISLSNYTLATNLQSFQLNKASKLIIKYTDHKNFLDIHFNCIQTVSEQGKINGFILLGNSQKNKLKNRNKSELNISLQHRSEFDLIPCGIFIKDLSGKVIDCNETLVSMLGLKNISELVELDSYRLATKGHASVKSNDQKVIKSKKTMMFEEEVTLQNGKRHCFQTIKAPYYNNHNEVIGIIGTSIDITKKKNSETQLNKKLKHLKQESIKSYNYLDRIIASIPCNVWWTDKNNTVVGANKRAMEFSGIKSREDLIGLTYEDVGKRRNNPKAFRKFYDDDMEVIRTGIAKENIPEPPVINSNGEKVFYLTTRSPLLDENGNIDGVIGTSMDITSRVVAEKKLKAAQKKIEASARAKDEFLATVSHELRTPLNGILGMADILSRRNLPPKDLSMISDLTKSGAILLSLIDDLLDITKIDLHEIKLNSSKLNLEEAITEVINHLSLQIAKKSLQLEFNYSSDLPKLIKADTQRIKQILFNIIGNAIKYTEKGCISISVDAKKNQKDSNILIISIKDTGIGIPEDKLEYIFDRFTQVRSDSTKHILGAGLGLNIAKSLIKLMGGTISVTSRLNLGSIFTIELPFEAIENSQSTDKYHSDPCHAKILVIDDDIGSGEKILHDLQPSNSQLVSSASAIKIIGSNHQLNSGFDIIILNVSSIGVSCDNLITQILETYRHLNLTIILFYDTLTTKLKNLSKHSKISLCTKLPESKDQLISALQEAWDSSLKSKRQSTQSVLDMNPHVLLVEDNLINQKIAIHLLTELNCTMDVSPDGKTAIAWSKKNNYDLILLDIGLPDIDGTIAAKSIRKIKGKKGSIPIIAMTAYASENDKERCLNSGMNDVITKPVDLNMLRTVMYRWLSEKVI